MLALTIARETLNEAVKRVVEHGFEKSAFFIELVRFCSGTIDTDLRKDSYSRTVMLVDENMGIEATCSIPIHDPYRHLVFKAGLHIELPNDFFFWSNDLKLTITNNGSLRKALRMHKLR